MQQQHYSGNILSFKFGLPGRYSGFCYSIFKNFLSSLLYFLLFCWQHQIIEMNSTPASREIWTRIIAVGFWGPWSYISQMSILIWLSLFILSLAEVTELSAFLSAVFTNCFPVMIFFLHLLFLWISTTSLRQEKGWKILNASSREGKSERFMSPFN